jgi:tRNA (guanine37-N1)-methyltransferase
MSPSPINSCHCEPVHLLAKQSHTTMKISILTLFPEMFIGPFDHSIIRRAKEKNLLEIEFINIRDFGIGKHKVIDDAPYGGGTGMIMRADVLAKAIRSCHSERNVVESRNLIPSQKTILLSASGQTFNQQKAKQLSKLDHLILLCGHYEGVDERIKKYIDEEISIGDFILTGGEIPSMLITDSVARLITGTLKEDATAHESFSLKGNALETYLEYPHYTRPPVFEDMPVPEILLSGNHKKIHDWQMKKAREKTLNLRPDLLK